MSQPIDTEAIRARLAEYDPDAPRCTKTVAESRNYAPDSMDQSDPEWDTYTVTHYVPCCRPEGHEGECRNSRRVMGWPGRATLAALLDEVERLRKEVSQKRSRAELDELLARVEQGARSVERDKIVAWLRTRKDKLGQLSTKAQRIADAIERGEHRREGGEEVMDLNKLRELAETHLPVPVEAAQIAHETYCPRIGGPVELYDGTCPECGWRYRLSTHSAVSVHPEDLHALIEEVDRLRARLRETAQILIAEFGATGPMDAEDAARKAVERMTLLRTLADERASEAGLYARRMEQAQQSRDKERAAVVAWLRDVAETMNHNGDKCCGRVEDLAEAIERGEHRREEER